MLFLGFRSGKDGRGCLRDLTTLLVISKVFHLSPSDELLKEKDELLAYSAPFWLVPILVAVLFGLLLVVDLLYVVPQMILSHGPLTVGTVGAFELTTFSTYIYCSRNF